MTFNGSSGTFLSQEYGINIFAEKAFHDAHIFAACHAVGAEQIIYQTILAHFYTERLQTVVKIKVPAGEPLYGVGSASVGRFYRKK